MDIIEKIPLDRQSMIWSLIIFYLILNNFYYVPYENFALVGLLGLIGVNYFYRRYSKTNIKAASIDTLVNVSIIFISIFGVFYLDSIVTIDSLTYKFIFGIGAAIFIITITILSSILTDKIEKRYNIIS